jgi:hypothetical protein
LLRLKAALKETKTFPPELIDRIKLSHLGPSLLSNALMALPDEQYENRQALLGGLRLYPTITRFRERNKHWVEEQSSALPIPAWYKILPETAITEIIDICSEKIATLTSQKSAG